ncbi:nuclear transport factor 2 [Penicillium longicatenatum]|uniref:nuclear transport factor 2 n=1 Tax=Penicillium longicatenatum TaxID=1561947 RepID=UPI002548307D|nr:nuclear transport factor 2 [Penicillium longicatenatum]KAJ5643749.1 nuclear transport factor 2 [Penicillium longicatenatum]KAJ5644885.1 nuclear transport factor 2 [Penicillium longicatenatum]
MAVPLTTDFESIAKTFVDYYYPTFDNNRSQLAGLYRDESMLTFERANVQGAAAIMEKFSTLGFNQVRHEVATVDSQPTAAGGVLVIAVGALITDGEDRPQNFVQTFNLVPEGNGGFWVSNDVFRLIFPAV